MPTYQPLGNRVLVKRAETAKQSAGGILIPDAAQKQTCRGEVVAYYEKRTGIALDLHLGDVVVFERFAGRVMDESEPDLVILNADDDLLAVVKE